MKFPNIYTFVGCPAIGELGDATQVQHFPVCPECRRRRRPEFTFIEYRFDRWAGEDLVTSMDCYAVSDRLARAFEEANISGVVYEDMAVSRGDYFEIIHPAYADHLPPFSRLVVTGRVEGPELWWTSWVCEKCGVMHWDSTEAGTHAEVAHLTGEVGIPREVFRDSWQGDDIFRLEDPGPPGVTQRFVDVVESLNVIGVELHPARWIDRV